MIFVVAVFVLIQKCTILNINRNMYRVLPIIRMKSVKYYYVLWFDNNNKRIWFLFSVIRSMKAAIRPSPNQNIDFCFIIFPLLFYSLLCFHRYVVAVILFWFFFRRLVQRLCLTENNSGWLIHKPILDVCRRTSVWSKSFVFVVMRIMSFKNRQYIYFH